MTSTADTAPLPDLAQINRADLWLAYFRRLGDEGKTLAEARRIADERFGFSSSTATGKAA